MFGSADLGNVDLDGLIGPQDIVQRDEWMTELESLPNQLDNVEIFVLLFCFQEVIIEARDGQQTLAQGNAHLEEGSILVGDLVHDIARRLDITLDGRRSGRERRRRWDIEQRGC